MMFISILPAMGPVRGNQLRALAVTSPQRSEVLPDVPTIAEAGLPGFSAGIRYGLSAPPGTPQPIVERLSKELRAAVLSDEMAKRLRFEGGRPIASTPEEYAADIDADEKRWGPLVRKLNLKFE
jgi:tripartite-type tricarboxylate transporter receptor subunit TctC